MLQYDRLKFYKYLPLLITMVTSRTTGEMMNHSSNNHTFHFYCSIDSLNELLIKYRKISESETIPQTLKVIINETAQMGSSWPDEKNACFQALFFAVHTMNTDSITVELEYE